MPRDTDVNLTTVAPQQARYRMDTNTGSNYEVFRDCISTTIIDKARSKCGVQPRKRSPKRRKNALYSIVHKQESGESSEDPAELADFIDVQSMISLICLPF